MIRLEKENPIVEIIIIKAWTGFENCNENFSIFKNPDFQSTLPAMSLFRCREWKFTEAKIEIPENSKGNGQCRMMLIIQFCIEELLSRCKKFSPKI